MLIAAKATAEAGLRRQANNGRPIYLLSPVQVGKNGFNYTGDQCAARDRENFDAMESENALKVSHYMVLTKVTIR